MERTLGRMMKFRCQSCGHRIAVPPRMMGRLVNCPECGGVTHPLAEQLVGGKAPGEEAEAQLTSSSAVGKSAAAVAHQVRHCDNCSRLIGRLEESHVWNGNVVCVACYANLPHMAPVAVKAAAKKVNPTPAAAAPAGDVQVLESRRVARPSVSETEGLLAVTPDAIHAAPSRLALLLATKPIRIVLALCTLTLAIYFVYSFIQVIGLLANVIVVGLLLLVALFVLFRPGPRSAAVGSTDTHLARRP